MNNKSPLKIKVMKILREKLFFDYKGYAEKYGEEAAERVKNYRSMAARKIADVRKSAKQDKSRAGFFEGLSRTSVRDSAIDNYTERSKKKLKAAEKLIQKAKEGTAKLEGYELGKKAANKAHAAAKEAAMKKATKLGKIGLGTAAIGTGLGYAAYKYYKNKKKDSDKNKESKKD